MATANYLMLLLLALIAGTVLGTGMEQQEQKEHPGPDPRRPRRPPPTPPRPTLPPAPPQPPQPPPAPPAGTHVVVTSAQAVGIKQEYVPGVDPGNPGPGIPGTGARNLASSSSSAPLSVGVFDRNPAGELQYQHKRCLHVTDEDNVATKRMKVKDESQKATEAQDKNRRPPVQGSAVKHSGFDCEGLIGVLLVSKRGRDGSEPTFNIESDAATAATIPETKDYQNAQSDDKVVPETDPGDDDTAEDSETDDSSSIYIDARGKVYRRLKNLRVVALLREGGEREEKCQNTGSPRAAAPDAPAQSPHSVIPPPIFADVALGQLRPLPPVHSLDLRSEHIHLEAVTDQRKCAAMSDPTQRTFSRGSATFKDPGICANQSRAYHRDVALSKGGEKQLCGHLPQKQRETSNVPLTAAPFGRGAHSHLAPQTRRAFAAAPPPLGGIRDNKSAQSDVACANLQSRAYQRDVALSKGGEKQLCGHLPQKQRETSNVPSTAAPFGRGAHSHLAPQTRRSFAAAPPPLGGIRDNKSAQSDAAFANLQQPEPRAGRREEQLQQNSAVGPMSAAPALEIECTFTFSPPYTIGAVGYDMNQQPAAGRPTFQNPPPRNPTATTLPGRQHVSACSGTPRNSRNQNGGNSNNQQGTAVQANNGLLLTGIGRRAPEASNSQPAAQQRRGGGFQEDDQRASAPDTTCRKDAHSGI